MALGRLGCHPPPCCLLAHPFNFFRRGIAWLNTPLLKAITEVIARQEVCRAMPDSCREVRSWLKLARPLLGPRYLGPAPQAKSCGGSENPNKRGHLEFSRSPLRREADSDARDRHFLLPFFFFLGGVPCGNRQDADRKNHNKNRRHNHPTRMARREGRLTPMTGEFRLAPGHPQPSHG